jgi:TP901 family phage tail tape measure protein
MGKDLLTMSTNIPMAAQGLGDIMAAAGQAGIAKEELLQFTEDAAKMGVAFDISGKEAGAAMTGLRSIFHLSQTEVVSLGDAFNYLSNNMDAKARDMLNISNRAGSMAAMFGLTGAQLGALGATFLALKSPPEIAATGINAMMLKLATADKQNKKFQEGLFAIGMSAEVMKKMISNDAQGALLTFLKAVKKAPDVMGTLSDLFGLEYSDDIAKLVNGLDTYEKSLQLIGDKSQYAGSMQKEYETRAATTANNIQLLQNQVARLGINIGNALLPSLNSVIAAFAPVIENLSVLAERFPMVTQVVVGGVAALIAYKIATIGLGYAWTFIKAPFLAANVAFSKARLGLAMLQAQTIMTTGSAGVFATAWTAVKLGLSSIASPLLAAGTAFRALTVSVWSTTAALLANPITWIAIGIGAAIAGMVVMVRKYLDSISAYISGVFNGIAAVMQPAIDALSSAFAPLAPVGEALGATFGWIGEGISQLVDWFSQLLTPVTLSTDEFNNISASGKGLGEVIGGVLYGAFTLLTLPIKAVGLAIGLLVDGFNAIASFSHLEKIEAAWQPVADFFVGLFDGIQNTIGNAMSWITDKVSWVTDKAQAIKGLLGFSQEEQAKPSVGNSLPKALPAGDSLPKASPVGDSLPKASPVGDSLPKATPVGNSLPKAASVGEVMRNSGITINPSHAAASPAQIPQPIVRNQSATTSQNITLNPTITIQGSSDPQATAALVDARVRAMLKDAQRSHSAMLFD